MNAIKQRRIKMICLQCDPEWDGVVITPGIYNIMPESIKTCPDCKVKFTIRATNEPLTIDIQGV